MKISFKTSGGFAYLPALSKPYIIDTAQIDARLADQLESMVRESRFFEQPADPVTLAKGAADHITYTITIEDGPHSHTIKVTDTIVDDSLRQLVSQLRSMSQPSKT